MDANWRHKRLSPHTAHLPIPFSGRLLGKLQPTFARRTRSAFQAGDVRRRLSTRLDQGLLMSASASPRATSGILTILGRARSSENSRLSTEGLRSATVSSIRDCTFCFISREAFPLACGNIRRNLQRPRPTLCPPARGRLAWRRQASHRPRRASARALLDLPTISAKSANGPNCHPPPDPAKRYGRAGGRRAGKRQSNPYRTEGVAD